MARGPLPLMALFEVQRVQVVTQARQARRYGMPSCLLCGCASYLVVDREPRTNETPIIEQRHGTPNRRAFMHGVLT